MNYDRAKLEAQLRIDEGLRYRPYQDSRGHWTAGIGHNLDAHGIDPTKLPDPIPDAMIEEWFAKDISDAEAALNRNLPAWNGFSDARQRAILNLCFNMGWPILSTFRNTLSAMLAGDWGGAADDLLASKYAEEVGDRATRIAALLVSDDMEEA